MGSYISRVTSPLMWVITMVLPLITLLITTHEPPSIFLHERLVGVLRLRVCTGGSWYHRRPE